MAKYERKFKGDFYSFVSKLNDKILKGSASASYEDGSFFEYGNVTCAVLVYERYSAFGQNRVSATVSVFAAGNDITVNVITSGGSQAMLFKINTIGEESFLSAVEKAIESCILQD